MPQTPNALTPLVTAAEIFPALEELAWGAQTELLLSFRIFDPTTKLRSLVLQNEGMRTWGELLARISERGVVLRMMMADFDALFARGLHTDAWTHARGFAKDMTGDSDVLCAPHDHRTGKFWHLVFRPKIISKINELRNENSQNLTPVQRDILQNGPILRPVTLHQKFAVADGQHAVLGGLDVDERRWDDPQHRRAPDDTWHDVSMSVTGPLCANIRAHFIDCWNSAVASGAPSLRDAGNPMQCDPMPVQNSLPRLVRTVSKPRRGATAMGPQQHITEHEALQIEALEGAKKYVYVETQYFRHKPLAEALARAAKAKPDLQLILLMPTAPDRIVFGGDDGVDARFAQALQIRNLDICSRAFGDRMAVVSPAKPEPANPDEDGTLGGAGIVYVHAKVTLIDDAWGLIGSANLNGRSMRWDTEASIAFDDPAIVRGLRERLAGIWLGDHQTLGDVTQAATWAKAARINQSRAPDQRSGFVMPYPETANRRFSRFLPILPADMF